MLVAIDVLDGDVVFALLVRPRVDKDLAESESQLVSQRNLLLEVALITMRPSERKGVPGGLSLLFWMRL